MSQAKRTAEDNLKIWGGTTGGIVAIGLLARQLHDAYDDIHDLVITAPLVIWLIFLCLLVIRAITLVRMGLARRSQLRQPESLLLQPDRSEHLAGRREEIDALLRICRDSGIIHLIGPSGVGKTALLKAGLIPELQHAGLFPIYLDSWRQDWDAGPRYALNEALWLWLSEGQKKKLGLTQKPQVNDLCNILRRCNEKLGPPVIIFDQFDDNLVQHCSRFFPEALHRSLEPHEL